MKKQLIFLFILLTYSISGLAQQNVGINTTTPDPSAALHVESTDKGMLIPRLTTQQRQTISNAAMGLLVFDTDTGSFWYRGAAGWVELGSPTWEKNGNDIYYSQGNVGIGIDNPTNPLEVAGKIISSPDAQDQISTSIGPGALHNTGDLWQSFTAGWTGHLTRLLSQNHLGGNAGTLYIYEGEGTSGNLLHSQAYTLTGGDGWKTFLIDTPISVTAGEKYTFRLSNSRWFVSDTDNPYPGGRSSVDPTRDFAFQTYVAEEVITTLVVSNNQVGIGAKEPNEKLEVAGAIKIENTINPNPAAGTIRWNPGTEDFEGYTGSEWKSLTRSGDKHWGAVTSSTENSKVITEDGVAGYRFGGSVSISGDYALIGVGDDYQGIFTGSAYVFVRSGNTWIQQAKLIAEDGATGDSFGESVSISGDYALIGAPRDDDQGSASGSAYVFVRSGSTWTQQAKLIAADGAADDYFGWNVSISGDYALIGAYGDDDQGDGSGSAYVFVRSGNTWTQQAKLIAEDGAADDNFGVSVSISGDYALIGARDDDDQGGNSGSAYVFVRSGNTWTQQAKLIAEDGAALDRFGWSVSISGDYALIGASLDDDQDDGSGSAYVFVRSGNTWTQQAKLIAADGAAFDSFGWSVSISGDYALIGAYEDDDFTGSAYFFE